jgi:hypothetical protein
MQKLKKMNNDIQTTIWTRPSNQMKKREYSYLTEDSSGLEINEATNFTRLKTH